MSKLYIKEKYATVPNHVLNDSNLSLKAKGLFAYLQSKPDGWKFSVERISKQTKDGANSIKSGIKELEEMGYLKRVPKRDEDGSGKWAGYDYILSENPSTENPSTENPMTVDPMTENGDTFSNKDNSKKDIVKKNDIYTIFDFWNNQEIVVHRDIEKFKSSINSALKNYSLDEIKDAILNYKKILTLDEYFWNYRWTLKEFLQRGLDKFLTVNKPFENFKQVRVRATETLPSYYQEFSEEDLQ